MLEIKTDLLKEAVTKSIKGSGQLPMLMLTNCMSIELKQGNLILTTTDGSINFYVKIKGFKETDTFYACTSSTLFAQLVSKTTVDTIGIEVRENALFFRGNGIYNLPLVQDEEGNIVKMPELVEKAGCTEVKTTVDSLRPLFKYNKLTIAKTKEIPYFAAYCISNSKAYTYNTANLCISNIILNNINILLPSNVAGLLELITDKDILFKFDGTVFNITSETTKITGTAAEGFEKYPIAAADDLLRNERFIAKVELNKTQVVNVLDRMSLFILPEDMNSLLLEFSDSALQVRNRAGNGCEDCMYLSSPKGTVNINTSVDITDLKTVVSAVETDSVEIAITSEGYLCVDLINAKIIIPSLSEDIATDEPSKEEQVEEQETDVIEENDVE